MSASQWAKPPAPPLTLAEVNQRLYDLGDELERQQPALEVILDELQRVTLAYELKYAAVIAASEAKSEDRRKAEAVVALSETYAADDDTEDLATRRAVLDMRVKAHREGMHNLRAQIQGLQTLSANLRSEMTMGSGGRP